MTHEHGPLLGAAEVAVALDDQRAGRHRIADHAVDDRGEAPDGLGREFARRGHVDESLLLGHLIESQRRELGESLMRNRARFAGGGVRDDGRGGGERRALREDEQARHLLDERGGVRTVRLVVVHKAGAGERVGAQTLLRDQHTGGGQQAHLHQVSPLQSSRNQFAPVFSGDSRVFLTRFISLRNFGHRGYSPSSTLVARLFAKPTRQTEVGVR